MEFGLHAFICRASGADSGEGSKGSLWLFGSRLKEPAGTRIQVLSVEVEYVRGFSIDLPFRIEEGQNDENQSNWYLNEIAHSPSNVIRRCVERHAVSCPERNQSTQLIPEL